MKKTFFLLFLFILTLPMFPQVRQEWVSRFNISGYNGYDNPVMELDNQGNIYISGTLFSGTDTNQTADIFLVKYSPAGSPQWVRYYNGTGNGSDYARDIYIDNYDCIFLLVDSYDGQITKSDYCILKYNSSGTLQWITRYDTPEHSNDRPTKLTKDNSGNIMATGVSNNSAFLTIKLNYLGVFQWARRFTALSAFTPVIAADNAGNVIVAGGFMPMENFYKGIFKYNSNGDSIWALTAGPAALTGYFSGIKIDRNNNIYTAGAYGTFSTYYTNYFTEKYSVSGSLLWSQGYPSVSSLADLGGLALDTSANVYVTGGVSTNPPPEKKFTTLKYSSGGAQQWSGIYYRGGGANGSMGTSICVDGNGNTYVTGKSIISGMNYDYATIKYNSSGDSLWVMRYEGPASEDDIPSSIKVDGYGNVYVTGISKNSGAGYSLATLKYSSSNWDNTIAQWFPLSTGNVWVYKHYTHNAPNPGYIYQGKVKYKITKDTLMSNGKRYWDRTILGYTRIDSAFMNVINYNYYSGESKRDSLRARLNDTLFYCLKVIDTSFRNIFGNQRRNKFVNNICVVTNQYYQWNITYGLGYWTHARITDGTIEGYIDTLVGAVINGIVYGDTSAPVGLQPITNMVPEKYFLFQNYPNPFNPVTKIKFSLPLPSKGGAMDVKLVVYDVLGREVANLIPSLWGGKEGLQPGTYEIEWDGSNSPSGVYFYKLITSDYTETKKMVLVK